MAMTLDEFTRSVDPMSLPRVLQIQSGIYFQGSVYEMFGRECCLPTGEIMKVTGITISKLTAEIHPEEDKSITVSLPLDCPGLFRIVADEKPYNTLGEIVDALRISSDRLGQPVFRCSCDLQLPDETVKKGESFTLVSLKTNDGEGSVDCEVMQRDPKLRFTLKLSQQGEFYECEDDQFYTLKELVEWKMPKGRKRTVNLVKSVPIEEMRFCELPENYSGELILTPVYELQAVMKFRKDVVHIPSNLDVEVIDVTGQCDSESFVQPLSLTDMFKKESGEFPFVAEIIETPLHLPEELKFLMNCKQVIIHSAEQAKRILASEIRSDRQSRFLLPNSYKGRFKRRPREFPTAYDLEVAKRDKEQLHVVATRTFESRYEGLATVLVGDQFLVQRREMSEVAYGSIRKMVEALACEKIEGRKYETVLIPMCLDGGFVEVIHDKKQYSISEICQRFHLPFNVKVAMRDLSVAVDMLAVVPGLHLEEEITDSYLVLHSQPRPTVPLTVRSAVEKISEDCYYTLRRYATASIIPPPRPPKKPKQPLSDSLKQTPPQPVRPQSSHLPKSPCINKPKPVVPVSSGSVKICSSVPISEKKMPSPVTLPNPVPRKASSLDNCLERKADSDDDTHDYEYIDEDEVDSIRKKFEEQNIHNTKKAKPSNAYDKSTKAGR
ncbi:protein THEMIS isoform X2 [Conger conger]|uniref:protein THEMIS isoform X2 n=1 Tax=Conger conger TaxID=82655 RepID=UPI002A5AE95F|nr:protein THEMIS isoform X2 [Conger conger]